MKKADIKWADREWATDALAENEKLTGAQLAAFIFHSTPDRILQEARGKQAAVIARKRAQIARLTADLANSESKPQATPPQASKSA